MKNKIRVTLSKEQIDKIFEDAKSQADYIMQLYYAALPGVNFDDIAYLSGYPVVNKFTGEYIFKQAINTDKIHCPEVFAGGAWMNRGFASYDGEHLENWQVETDKDIIVWKKSVVTLDTLSIPE